LEVEFGVVFEKKGCMRDLKVGCEGTYSGGIFVKEHFE
jgi:hypothetical protein